jgi:hypothetical protein
MNSISVTTDTPRQPVTCCLTPPRAPFPETKPSLCGESGPLLSDLLIPMFDRGSLREVRHITLNPRFTFLQKYLNIDRCVKGQTPEVCPNLELSFDLSDDGTEVHSLSECHSVDLTPNPSWFSFFSEDFLDDGVSPSLRLQPRLRPTSNTIFSNPPLWQSMRTTSSANDNYCILSSK